MKPTLHMKVNDVAIKIPEEKRELENLVANPVTKTPLPVYYEYPERKNVITLSPSRLIEQHLSEVRRRIELHSRSADYYEYWNRILGYPTTLISGFLSSTMMYALTLDNNKKIDIINLVLSCVLFFLSVTKKYIKYEEKNKTHDVSAKLYTTLSRSVELRLIKTDDVISREERKDMYKDLVEQMTIIEQFDLTVPDRIIKKYLQCKQPHC